jgi:hypothetical protein
MIRVWKEDRENAKAFLTQRAGIQGNMVTLTVALNVGAPGTFRDVTKG